jgi:hypothetical protein
LSPFVISQATQYPRVPPPNGPGQGKDVDRICAAYEQFTATGQVDRDPIDSGIEIEMDPLIPGQRTAFTGAVLALPPAVLASLPSP